MQSLVFQVNVIIQSTFHEDIDEEDYISTLENDKIEMDQEMELEEHERILPDLRNILPDVTIHLRYEHTGAFKRIREREFEYTIAYFFRVQSNQLYADYKKVKTIFVNDFNEISDYIGTHSDVFQNKEHYSKYSYIQFNVLEDPKVNATKRNIQARTAKRILSANRTLPMNMIGEIGKMIGTLPEGANRTRPLAEPLTNAAIERAAAAAAAPVPIPIQPPAPKKKAWWKLWGGRSRKVRRRSKRRTYTIKRR